MLSLQRTMTLGYLGQHPTRAVLVVLSIALGVATLVATQSLSRGLGQAANQSNNPLAGLADLIIDNGGIGVPAELADQLAAAKIEGVASVRPAVLRRGTLPELNNRSTLLLGIDLTREGLSWKKGGKADDLFGAEIRSTFKAKSPQEMLDLLRFPIALVRPELAEEIAAEIPKDKRTFAIRLRGPAQEVVQVGTIRFDSGGLPLGDALVVMDLPAASAAAFPGKQGFVTQINVKLEEGADKEAARLRLEDWLIGKAANVQTVEMNQKLASDVTAGLELGFAIGGVGALVVGLFLVYNALSVNVAERRHDIGILRSVGATRLQIAGLFVLEAAALGFAGSLLGLPLGFGLAWLAVKPLAQVVSELVVPVQNVRLQMSAGLMGAALAAGTVVAVLAALVPAFQAAGEEPADAVRRVPRHHGAVYFILQLAATAGLFAIGFLFVVLRQYLPTRFGVFGGVICLLMAALVATPMLAAVVGKLVQPFFRHFLGLEGRLAADNLVRSPGRTGLVIAALAATGALMVQTAGFLRSTEIAVRDWVEQEIAADLFVSSGSPASSASLALTMEETVRQELLQIPDVEAVLPIRYLKVKFNNYFVLLLAIDFDTFDRAAKDRPMARAIARFPDLRKPNKVLVSANFAALHGVKPGQKIKVPGKTAPLELDVVGTVVDYSWNRGTILVDRAWFRKEFGDTEIDIYDVYLKPGVNRQAVKHQIENTLGKQHALVIMTREQLQDDIRNQLQRIYGLAYAQQIIVGLVALLGVASALFISVLQRRRELGLLRAVGAARSQILRSVLAEAILMGAVGAVVGFGIGLLLEWYVLDIILIDEAGFVFALRIPWIEAGMVVFLSVALATVAGLWPAYQATRLRIPEAIAYE
jgi:putative ABC transport system permease protein